MQPVIASLQGPYHFFRNPNLEVRIRLDHQQAPGRVHPLDRIRVIVEGRAVDMVDVPGGGSGLLFRDFKGKDAGTPVYRFDAAIVNKLNETLRQAAQEMGQWGENQPAARELTRNSRSE